MSAHERGSRTARVMIYAIELYRNMISPLRPPSCRFTPTCSQYAVDALRHHGDMAVILMVDTDQHLGARRLERLHLRRGEWKAHELHR